MSRKKFFPPQPSANPTIYAYELVGVATHYGWLKIGFTDRDAPTRIREQLGTAAIQYNIVLEESAIHLLVISSNFASRKNTYCAEVMAMTNP